MHAKNLFKAATLAGLLVLLFLIAWETLWRTKGYIPTFNDDKALWAAKRGEVYQPQDKATVFLGSSRIKFDLDIPTWEEVTGEKPVQLSLVGTSPRLLLKDLADDENFKGKLVVDITEVLFFSQNPAFHQSAIEATSFYKDETPSELVSNRLGFALESSLSFLEERRFSLNTFLNDLEILNRPGVFSMPAFPKGFEWTTKDRQTYMSDLFLQNKADVKRQTDIWNILIMGDPTPPLGDTALQNMLQEIKTDVDKIRARGGKVMFVRTPSSGPMYEGEKKKYPRGKYWNAMLAATNTEGLHFEDDSITAKLVCPEWSHLSRQDAVVYTKQLVRQLQGKNWFANPN